MMHPQALSYEERRKLARDTLRALVFREGGEGAGGEQAGQEEVEGTGRAAGGQAHAEGASAPRFAPMLK